MENIFESWLISNPIANRGLFDNVEVPENSLSAFKNAIENGYSIELDVRMISDGKIIVFHDDKLCRMTGADGYTDNCTYPQIEHLRLLNSEDKIPTLEEVLNVVNGRVPLLIEIKNDGKVGTFEKKVYEMLKKYNGEYAIQSFNPFSVEWFKNNAPEITRGLLSGGFKNSHLGFFARRKLKTLALASVCKPHFINYDISYLPNRFVNKKGIKELPLLAYTIKSTEQYHKALKYCDNVIFDSFIPTI